MSEIGTTIDHLRDVFGEQTYESLARKGETITTAAMATHAYDQDRPGPSRTRTPELKVRLVSGFLASRAGRLQGFAFQGVHGHTRSGLEYLGRLLSRRSSLTVATGRRKITSVRRVRRGQAQEEP